MKRTPYTPQDFAWTKWTAEDIKKLTPQVIAEKKAGISAVKKIPDNQRNFENTVALLESAGNNATDTILKIELLKNVSPEKTVRDSAKKAIETIENRLIALARDPAIWHALKAYEAGAWKKENKTLAPEDKKLFHDIFLEYKRMGFDLPPAKQKKIKELEQHLAKLENNFRHNINIYHDYILVTDTELAGLPERYIQGLKQNKDGRRKITLAYPDYYPFMKLAKDEAKRKELSEKALQKGGQKNMKILTDILKIRAEHAKLLGYKHHADYKTEPRMAKNAARVQSFLEGLIKKVSKDSKHDLAELRDLKREMTQDQKAELYHYDIAYYGHELQKRRFHLDSEEVREYFPLDRVLQGTMKLYGTLFSVQFEKLEGFPMWHEDITLYAIKNPKGDILSYFALDLHPREEKYGHAMASGNVSGRETTYRGTAYKTPFATLVTNFPKPSPSQPSLLSHGEVETFLHEFGHIMHYTLTTARYASQAGYNTSWDFVEAPSQMLEHWAWEPKALALLSEHVQTKKPFPKTILTNLLASKQHLLRYATLRQLTLARFDLALHTTTKPKEPAKLYRDMVKQNDGIVLPPKSIFPAGFGHLSGYDAGYYGYMWSNVYAADMFTRFEKEGVLNKKTGSDYKRFILEMGGSRDELELVKAFLKRAPSNKAFLKEIGVK